MTQEDKQLLLIDLCTRLPYGVKCHDFTWDDNDDIVNTIETLECIYPVRMKYKYKDIYGEHEIERIKPYLRPMSSMTKEEVKEYRAFHCITDEHPYFYMQFCTVTNELNMFDWLNRNHFDYRGLIERGLALEAPDGMYEINKK